MEQKKPVRFWIRDDIENAIKKQNIDRSRFHEFSKLEYTDIIRRFYFTFSDIKNHVPSLAYIDMHFRSELKKEVIDCFFRTDDWSEYLKAIKDAIPDKNCKLFMILYEGWVYEGYLDELFNVLENVCNIRDFYIVSPKFEWFIAVSYIEDNAELYQK